jgi:pimeloyl-ACP methyl ester carboxylesterase
MLGGTVAGIGLATATASSDFVGLARAQFERKTFVLIPGSFCGGWYWRRVADLLEAQGHKVFSPTLTGLGERAHLLSNNVNMDTHIADIVNLIRWESLADICLVAHSYGGAPGSGALEHIGDRVSSIVWLDAFKMKNGQAALDMTNDATRKRVLDAAEKGEAGFPPLPRSPAIIVGVKDQAFVDSKQTPHPIGAYKQAMNLSGAIEKVAKKTYIRIPKYPSPAFDRDLVECKADKSWSTFELADSGHLAMLDAPERLTELLVHAA